MNIKHLASGLLLAWSGLAAASTNYFMPYGMQGTGNADNGITVVNAANFSDVRTVLASTAVITAAQVHYAFTLSSGAITDPHPDSLVYVRFGKFYRLSLLSTSSLTPVRISSETMAASLCGRVIVDTSLSSPNAADLIYQLKGADAACGTADDTFFLTRLNANATAAPTALGIKSLSLLPLYSSTHVLQAFLTREGSELKLYNASLANPVTVMTGVTSYSVVATDTSAALFIANGVARRVTSTGVLSGALHTLSPGFTFSGGTQNANTVFFSEHATSSTAATQGKLFRLPLDGSAPSTLMLTSAVQVYAESTTTNNLIFTSGGEFSTVTFTYKPTYLKAIALTAAAGAPAPVQLDSVASGFMIVEATSGGRVYYEIYNFTGNTTVAKVKTDVNTIVANYQVGSSFAGGAIIGTSGSMHGGFSNLLLVTGKSGTDFTGAALKNLPVVPSGALAPVTLTTFTQPVTYVGAFALGPSGLGLLSTSTGPSTEQNDVVGVNFSTSTYAQITNTPATNEVPE